MSSQHVQLFDYLSAAHAPIQSEAAIVFGRKDILLAHALGDLIISSLVETAVISGGLGKDSGDIANLGFDSEAAYVNTALQADAKRRAYGLPPVHLEKQASNGGQNVRNSLDIMLNEGINTGSLTAVAHATSARRLAEMLKHEGQQKLGIKPIVHTQPTAYNFDPTNPTDQAEAVDEFHRLMTWPDKGWLAPQPDLPENLVDFVTEQKRQ